MYALSAPAFSIAEKCASVSSIAEHSFLRSASRACARESAVSSVISWSGRHTKMDFRLRAWPPADLVLPELARPIPPTPVTAGPGTQKTGRRLPQGRQPSAIPCSPGRQARSNPVRKRGTWLFHHLRHQEEMILMRRGITYDVVGLVAIRHGIHSHFHRHRRHRRHRLNAVHINLGELLDEGQDGIQLALEIGDLVLGYGDAREVRHTANGFSVNGHQKRLSWPRIRGRISALPIAEAPYRANTAQRGDGASAAFSTGIRTARMARFRIVNTRA